MENYEDFDVYAEYEEGQEYVGTLILPVKDGTEYAKLPQFLEIDGVEYFPKP